MSDLTENELLEILNIICDRAVSVDEQLQDKASQVYTQLRAIVEQHSEEPRQVRGRLDRYNKFIYEGDKVLAIPYEHIIKKREVGVVFWMDEYSTWGVQIWDNEEKGIYHSYLFSQLDEIEVLERKADTEAEETGEPYVVDCPSCGKEWDMGRHTACQCGATLTRQPVQVDEETKNPIGWIDRTLKGWYSQTRADINKETKQAYRADIAVLERIKQLLTRQPVQVDEEFIRRKADELMCDVDSGDEIANYEFLHDLAKQLLSHSPTSGNNMSDKRGVSRGWLVKKLQEVEKRPDLLWSRSLLFTEAVLKELGMEVIK